MWYKWNPGFRKEIWIWNQLVIPNKYEEENAKIRWGILFPILVILKDSASCAVFALLVYQILLNNHGWFQHSAMCVPCDWKCHMSLKDFLQKTMLLWCWHRNTDSAGCVQCFWLSQHWGVLEMVKVLKLFLQEISKMKPEQSSRTDKSQPQLSFP